MLDNNLLFCLLIAVYIIIIATKALSDGKLIIGGLGYIIALCQIYYTLKVGKII